MYEPAATDWAKCSHTAGVAVGASSTAPVPGAFVLKAGAVVYEAGSVVPVARVVIPESVP